MFYYMCSWLFLCWEWCQISPGNVQTNRWSGYHTWRVGHLQAVPEPGHTIHGVVSSQPTGLAIRHRPGLDLSHLLRQALLGWNAICRWKQGSSGFEVFPAESEPTGGRKSPEVPQSSLLLDQAASGSPTTPTALDSNDGHLGTPMSSRGIGCRLCTAAPIPDLSQAWCARQLEGETIDSPHIGCRAQLPILGADFVPGGGPGSWKDGTVRRVNHVGHGSLAAPVFSDVDKPALPRRILVAGKLNAHHQMSPCSLSETGSGSFQCLPVRSPPRRGFRRSDGSTAVSPRGQTAGLVEKRQFLQTLLQTSQSLFRAEESPPGRPQVRKRSELQPRSRLLRRSGFASSQSGSCSTETDQKKPKVNTHAILKALKAAFSQALRNARKKKRHIFLDLSLLEVKRRGLLRSDSSLRQTSRSPFRAEESPPRTSSSTEAKWAPT